MNNVKRSIGWADFTWNPVTGCHRGCSYCYASRIHKRFFKGPFETITMHQDRLKEKMPKKPARIFVGSMSDVYFWPAWMLDLVLGAVVKNKQHTFMFLSKDPWAYIERQWPGNTMQGLTMTLSEDAETQAIRSGLMARLPRPFLSAEPLLGSWKYGSMDKKFKLVIMGAMTGPGSKPPQKQWIDSVLNSVPSDKLFIKNNIKGLVEK